MLQFTADVYAKIRWENLKLIFTGQAENRITDALNELTNLEIKFNESVNDHMARARGISTKCQALRLFIVNRELVFCAVRINF